MLDRAYDFKIGLRYVITLFALLATSAAGIILWASYEQERTAIEQAKEFSTSVHQMTMAGLTGMMLTGTMGQRELFLDQIEHSNNIHDLRVVRGESVNKQFGPGRDEERPADAVERAVLAGGEAYSGLLQRDGRTDLRVVIPAVAAKEYLGKNCLMCHTVPEGTVLGAVSMVFSLDRVEASVEQFRWKVGLATAGFSLFVLLVVAWGTCHFVTNPLKGLTAGLRVIAEGEGDLTRRLPVKGRDEIAEASTVFNQVMEKFRALILHVRDSADQVAASSREVLGTAQEVSRSSASQQRISADSAGAVEGIAGRMDEVADRTQRVQELSHESLNRTRDSNRSLTQLGGQVREVEGSVEEIATLVGEFIKNTAAITEMTGEVRSIAEQTNMLALNAAIEAARAGEQGRGFAVVADEVRTLAVKSAQSANQIDEVTQDLNRQSTRVEASIESGLGHLRSSRDSMGAVGAVLSEATAAVEEVVSGLDEIAAATAEQRAATHEVSGHVENIAAMAAENSERTRATEGAVAELERLAEGLQAEVRSFRVD